MDWKKESETFNQIADIYDVYRPSYPQEIIKEMIQESHLKSGSKIIEIGAGSGKATELIAGKGYLIHCIEPGQNLVNIGQKRFANDSISYTVSRFEDCSLPENYYDMVFAAQSFHWVPQPIGYEKSARILKQDGYLGLIWNMYVIQDTEQDSRLIQLSNKYGGFADFLTESQCTKRMSSIVSGIDNSGLFEEVKTYKKIWVKNYTPQEYYGFILTGNKFAQKTESEKKIIYQEIESLANDFGGYIHRPYWTVLYLAKKR
jgi:ubiquinone/menaquinone biosynthesis C-methylase UbiE